MYLDPKELALLLIMVCLAVMLLTAIFCGVVCAIFIETVKDLMQRLLPGVTPIAGVPWGLRSAKRGETHETMDEHSDELPF